MPRLKPRLVVTGHTHGDEGTITVCAAEWEMTLDQNRTLRQTVKDLEREIKSLTTGEATA